MIKIEDSVICATCLSEYHYVNRISLVFVAQMIDFEFAHVGNPARDVGVVIAMFISFYYYHLLCPDDNPAHRQLAYKILDACKAFGEHAYYLLRYL